MPRFEYSYCRLIPLEYVVANAITEAGIAKDARLSFIHVVWIQLYELQMLT